MARLLQPSPTTRSHRPPSTHHPPEQPARNLQLVGVVLVVLAVGLAGPLAQGQAAVTPSSGGPWAAFAVTFPAQAVVLDVQLTAPRGCGWLDDLTISIRRAQSGRFRFGPRVAG